MRLTLFFSVLLAACSGSGSTAPPETFLVGAVITSSNVDPFAGIYDVSLLITPASNATGTIFMAARASDGLFSYGGSPGGTGLSASWEVRANNGATHTAYACATSGSSCTADQPVFTLIF